MNRTTVYLALAGSLVLIAVIVGMPKTAVVLPTPTSPLPTPPPPPPSAPTPTPPVAKLDHGSLSLSGSLSHPYLVPGTSDVFATLEVSAVDVPGASRAPVNLALVIDRSGSMAGEKLAQAKRAASRLVDLLDEHDRLAVIHYGTDVTPFPSVFCTNENRAKLKQLISRLRAEGGTNIGDGLAAGQAQLAVARSDFRVNRLLLLSDGQPTVGVTTAAGLVRLVTSIRANGVSVTSLGVGADFNEELMQRLADVGGGAYGFVSDSQAMATMFEKDLKQAGTLVAQGVTVNFTPPEGVEFREVFGRPSTVQGRTVTVTLPDFSARQTEKLVVRFTATRPSGDASVDISNFVLGYKDLLTEHDASAALRLSAMVTNDVKLAETQRNKDAFLTATRAQAAQNYQKAAVAIDRGDFAEAQSAIQSNTQLLDSAAVVGGAASVEADRKQNDLMFGLSTGVAAEPEPMRRLRSKEMKTQSLRGSGRSADSVY